ncbi:MAG TPA: TRAP transporter large permease [Candidatus Methylomirabilis sp.]|nr:TRAP transporter large permease [Candidatus Methylomirabilis sp.]
MDLVILFGTLVLLMLVGVPIGFSMGLAGTLFLVVTGQIDMLIMIPNRMVLAVDSYGLMAIPFFFLAGSLMLIGGLTLRLVAFSRVVIGHITGGLSLVNVVASMTFAGVSGSCVADASAIGSVLIPAMKKDKYPAEFAAAVTASAATCGHIIPPSIPMVLIGVMQELPIGKLFLAGAIPGTILGLSLMGTAWVISRRRNYPREERRATLREMGRAFLDGFLTLIMPGIIVGGIIFGVVTITETGVLACLYALLLGFIYREIRLDNFWRIVKDTAKGVSNILVIVASAGFFGYVVMNTGVGDQLVSLILSLSTERWAVLTMLVIFLLIIGCGLDVLAIIFVFVPVMYPLIQKVGIDPYHFSAVFVLSLGIALLTPPVGVLLYLASDMAEASMIRVIRELIPFLLVEIGVMLLVTYVPVLSTWLPRLLSK